MYIEIPAKYIYSIENKKTKNNTIRSISTTWNDISQKRVANTPIYSTKVNVDVENNSFEGAMQEAWDFGTSTATATFKKTAGAVYVAIIPTYSFFNVEIPRSQNDLYVESVYYGMGQNNQPNITYSLVGKQYKEWVTAQYLVGNQNPVQDITKTGLTFDEYADSNITLPIYQPIEEELQIGEVPSKKTIKASLDFYSNENTDDVTPIINKDTITFSTLLSVLTKVEIIKMYGMEDDYNDEQSIFINGERQVFEANEITFNFNGTALKLVKEEKNIIIGSGSKNTQMELQGNELMQNPNQITSAYQKVIDGYKNGKETAVIRCAIANYKDWDNDSDSIKIDGKNLFPYYKIDKYIGGFYLKSEDGGIRVVGTASAPMAIPVSRFLLTKGTYCVYDNNMYAENYVLTIEYGKGVKNISKGSDLNFTLDEDTMVTIGIFVSGDVIDVNSVVRPMISLGNNKIAYEPPYRSTFHLYDKVIPYLHNGSPMSVDINGDDMMFQVMAIKFSSKGQVFQELFLQEA